MTNVTTQLALIGITLLVITFALAVIAYHLADLKAYTMTQIGLLQQIAKNQLEE